MNVITIERKILEKNDEIARTNRDLFQQRGIFVINVVSSPGSGKTCILERCLERLKPQLEISVIEGDVQTDFDAQRVARYDVPVVQVVTKGGCHLEARLVQDAVDRLDLTNARLLVIENVGNLVCPANYDLGEALKVVVLSTTEGADKPLKYPTMFRNSSVLLINKIDLLPYVDCDMDELQRNALRINPDLKIFPMSAKTGEGIAEWCDWLLEKEHGETVMKRVRIAIRGAVQGVGFRPFVYHLATKLRLAGWVLNSTQGVLIEAEAEQDALQQLLLDLEREAPPHSYIQSFEFSYLDPVGFQGFEIRESTDIGTTEVVVLPDIATCPRCVDEILDPRNRRFRYPFTNCTHCGPRFSIIEALPYDRANTSMKRFPMCTACAREYQNVADRRFHAQPTACADCGPHLELWDRDGSCLAKHDNALQQSVQAIRAGRIVAVKGLGGFHLMVDALDGRAVTRLRERKQREQKPLAVMYSGLEDIARDCHVSALEQRCLLSAECPIILLQRRGSATVATEVAPGNPYLGVLLPYTPLHHLLLRDFGAPLVATSGNLSEEPICTDEQDALARLGGIADLFLVHNRPIVRHVDDSIVRVMLGRELVLRRARGYAPLPQRLPRPRPTVLAVGAHLKNTVALSVGRNVFLSQHIGDLENAQASQAFRDVIDSFRQLYQVQPDRVAADMHPDYVSTRFARDMGLPVIPIQHHFAHVVSCMAENHLTGEVLGIAWDGTGYGPDGTIWGGEFLVTDGISFRRAAALRKFRLPGGERAVREPRRSALGVLYEIFGEGLFERDELGTVRAFDTAELPVLRTMLDCGINSPWTSSAGRLFDAVASIIGLRQQAGFEGQAAMDVEFSAAQEDINAGTLALPIRQQACSDGDSAISQDVPHNVVDWEPLIVELIRKMGDDVPVTTLAAEFHLALAATIVEVARRTGQQRVVLSGGCFQNRLLTECAVRQLEAAGLRPYWHQRIPPNDGGIALGQAVAALQSRND